MKSRFAQRILQAFGLIRKVTGHALCGTFTVPRGQLLHIEEEVRSFAVKYRKAELPPWPKVFLLNRVGKQRVL